MKIPEEKEVLFIPAESTKHRHSQDLGFVFPFREENGRETLSIIVLFERQLFLPKPGLKHEKEIRCFLFPKFSSSPLCFTLLRLLPGKSKVVKQGLKNWRRIVC